MPRKQIYVDEATADRLIALVQGPQWQYASDSEAIRVAVERLYESHFHPTSAAVDEVLERVRAQFHAALGVVNGELSRRTLED